MNARFKKFCNKKIENPEYYESINIEDCITPVTILLGPNGCGKSMSLRSIEVDCSNNKIDCIKYSNKNNDIVTTSINFEPWKLACAFHSEGERICDSVDNWARSNMLKSLLTHEKDLYILVDELDSGLSIDRLIEQISSFLLILRLEKEKHPDRNVKIVFTCNTWEMLECFKNDERVTAYWLPTKEKFNLSIATYEQFRNLYVDYYNFIEKNAKN